MSAIPGTPRFSFLGKESFGVVEPTQGIAFTTPSGAGLEAQSGKKHDWVRLENTRGSGFFSVTPTTSGQGDGRTAIENKKGTNSITTQSGDKSQPSITGFGNADNSAITIDSGGGRAATINIATGDGLCSITLTSANGGLISARVGDVGWTINGAKKQLETNMKQVIQEKPSVAPFIKQYQKDLQTSLREAFKPYSDKCGSCGGDGKTSEGSGCTSCGSTGVSNSAPTGSGATSGESG